MKTGPHRKLQLLSGSQTLPTTINTNGTIESADNSPKTKSRSSLTIVATSLQGNTRNKTPSKQTPQPVVSSAQPKHNLRSSISQNQLTYTLVSAKTGEATPGSKAFHPVLKKTQIDLTSSSPLLQQSRTPTNQQVITRKSTNSFTILADKVNSSKGQVSKSQSKPTVTIKEQPFNYEERQKSAGETVLQIGRAHLNEDNLKDVQKQLSSQYNTESNHKKIDKQTVKQVEVFYNDQNLEAEEDKDDEVKMRPSNEISMNQDQQLLFVLGSGFTHSRIGSGHTWNTNTVSTPGALQTRENSAGRKHFFDTQANNSYRVMIEETGDGGVQSQDQEKVMTEKDYMAIEEKFEVIREDTKDSFYSPKLEQRDNSDFKKFNQEDDYQNQVIESRWISRIGAGGGANVKNDPQPNNFLEPFGAASHNLSTNQYEFKTPDGGSGRPLLTLGQSEEQQLDNGDDRPIDMDQFDDTPKNIKDREMKHQLFQEQLPNQHFDTGNHAHVLSFSEDNNNALVYQNQNTISNPNANNSPGLMLQNQEAQNANAIIEIEKNYVIMQYESLLSQLSNEFQKVLTKTKETDEHLAQQEFLIQTQKKQIEEREAEVFQQKQFNSQITIQYQELLSEFESLTMEKQRREQAESQNEAQAAERNYLEQQLQTLDGKLRMQDSQESMLRDQIDQLQNKLRIQEGRLRQKDEELFSIQRMISAFERDIQSVKDLENGARLELQRAHSNRLAVEDQIQEMRQRATADQILLRVKENELENVHREFKALKGIMDAMQLSYTQVMRENDQLKSSLNDYERANIQMNSLFATKESQASQLESDIDRLKGIIDKERMTSKKVEDSYRLKLEQLQNEIRELQQQNRDLESNQRSFDNNRVQTGYHDTIQSTGRYNDVFSPNRSIEEPKSNINWVYGRESTNQSVVPQAQQRPMHNQEEIGRNNQKQGRKIIMNQNASSLNDHLSWENGRSGVPQVQKSIERPLTANVYQQNNNPNLVQGKQAGNKLNLQQQFSPKNNINLTNIFGGGGLGGSGSGPKNSSVGNTSFHEDPKQQAAGKRTTLDTSPFTVTQEATQKQMSHLQNTLSAMQIDKERIENEYRKLGTSKNKQQIERKKELEFEQEVIEKNIHQIKQKLRELNAF